ncbi:hypothetical protein [Pectinatus frisingensis]|uniref:hypothetical protein n=1 Tax=Pectinatus frisingensis TaxID=865 RepID=UPI0018C6EAC1|nr:hypothetical protein [Pectinatus frisingensis]
MAKRKLFKGKTGIGEVLFAHLLKPEEFKGVSTNKFSVMLKLSEKDKKKLLDQIDEEWNKFKESDECPAKKFKYDYSNGLKEYKEEEYFKFKMTHIIKCKDGTELEKSVPIFDAATKEISKTITGVGNGSKAIVAFELSPFYMNDKNYGVSLRLLGIQILDMVEYGSNSAAGLGFDKEDGYSQENEANTVDTDDEIPFSPQESEGDF